MNMDSYRAESTVTSDRYRPVMPPMMKFHSIAYVDIMGSRVQIRPRQIVPRMTRKSMPVGTEIISVVSMKAPLRFGAQPEAYMWCAHTMTLSTEMPTMPSTAVLKLNSGLRENTAVSSIRAATAGIKIT